MGSPLSARWLDRFRDKPDAAIVVDDRAKRSVLLLSTACYPTARS